MPSSRSGELPWEILPGVGLGWLRFGLTEEKVLSILGPPGKRMVFDDDGDTHLCYPNQGLTLFFEGCEGNLLSGIEVEQQFSCSLLGRDVFSLSLDAVKSWLGKEWPRSSVVECSEPDETTRLSFREEAIDFYFDSAGQLHEINWGLKGED